MSFFSFCIIMYFIGDIFSSPALFSPHYFTSRHGSKCRSNKLLCLTIRFACCIFRLMRCKGCLYTSLKCVFVSLQLFMTKRNEHEILVLCNILSLPLSSQHHLQYSASCTYVHMYVHIFFDLSFDCSKRKYKSQRMYSSERTCIVNKRRKTT